MNQVLNKRNLNYSTLTYIVTNKLYWRPYICDASYISIIIQVGSTKYKQIMKLGVRFITKP